MKQLWFCKKYILYFLFFGCFVNTYSQGIEGIFKPDNSTKIKKIRVHITYVLTGIDGYQGNFHETGDGYNNTKGNGFQFANLLISEANRRCSENEELDYFNGTYPPEVIDKKYQYILSGVHYIRDKALYNDCLGDTPFARLKAYYYFENSINIYITPKADNWPNGVTYMIGSDLVAVFAWYPYVKGGHPIIHAVDVLNHEVGHSLGLSHTISNNGCGCVDDDYDGLSDTPTRAELRSEYGNDIVDKLCTAGDDGYQLNNLMDCASTNFNALTPLQIGKIHYSLCELYMHKCDWDEPIYTGNKILYASDLGKREPLFGYQFTVGDGTTATELAAYKPAVIKFTSKVILSKGFKAARGCYFHADLISSLDPYKSTAGPAEFGITEDDTDQLFNVIVFPNPSDGVFTIQSTNNKAFNYKVFNSLGILVLEKNSVTYDEINLTGSSSGVYFIQVYDVNKNEIKRITIM